MKVQDVMSREVESCRADEDLNRAAQLMWEHDLGVVPVLDPAGAVVGLITDRDVCMAAYTQGRPLASIYVRDVMSWQVQSCAPGSSLETALSTMKESRVRRLPVIDLEGGLVGLLSLNDLARVAFEQARRGDRHLSLELADTLAVICEPRGRRGEKVATPESEPTARVPSRRVGALTV